MPSSRARFLVALFASLCLLVFAVSCGDSDDDMEDATGGDAEEAEVAQTKYQPTGQEGAIAGTISFSGPAPAPKPISMDQDPVCAQAGAGAVAEDIVVNGDKLSNVFVYIKEGKVGDRSLSAFGFDAPAQPQVLDQKGCRYVPHVIGIQTKQNLNVLNSDATSHNVNVDAKLNGKFNQGQPNGAPPIVKQFARNETLIPVKCNQHPWMRAYIGVLSHPFFSVSGQDGRFEIKGVPAGTYTVVAWHEKYPQGQTTTVTVAPSASAEANFSFSAQQLTAENVEQDGGALKVLPAIEFPLVGHH
ncbi:MAG TPA: carboxypeptidase regulatory-like domain-containing protein [Pyrinomonadaceae bacterium]|nr:carboxypeptidase regulatory-like domain-containing protein [Pyrinomonadaceae bacterium]